MAADKRQGTGQMGAMPTFGAHGQGSVGSYPAYRGNIISEKINTSPGVPMAPARAAADAKVRTTGMPAGNKPSAPRPGH